MPKKPKREPIYPTSVRLRKHIRDLLREDSEQHQRSVSSLLAEIIEKWYEWRKKQKKAQAARE